MSGSIHPFLPFQMFGPIHLHINKAPCTTYSLSNLHQDLFLKADNIVLFSQLHSLFSIGVSDRVETREREREREHSNLRKKVSVCVCV